MSFAYLTNYVIFIGREVILGNGYLYILYYKNGPLNKPYSWDVWYSSDLTVKFI